MYKHNNTKEIKQYPLSVEHGIVPITTYNLLFNGHQYCGHWDVLDRDDNVKVNVDNKTVDHVKLDSGGVEFSEIIQNEIITDFWENNNENHLKSDIISN